MHLIKKLRFFVVPIIVAALFYPTFSGGQETALTTIAEPTKTVVYDNWNKEKLLIVRWGKFQEDRAVALWTWNSAVAENQRIAEQARLARLERLARIKASTPPPVQTAHTSDSASVSNGSVWDRLAQCESGGNWSINTGNGYYGGIQFSLSSWQGVGGVGYPHQASRETQIAMGERLLSQGGWAHWPACSKQLGLR